MEDVAISHWMAGRMFSPVSTLACTCFRRRRCSVADFVRNMRPLTNDDQATQPGKYTTNLVVQPSAFSVMPTPLLPSPTIAHPHPALYTNSGNRSTPSPPVPEHASARGDRPRPPILRPWYSCHPPRLPTAGDSSLHLPTHLSILPELNQGQLQIIQRSIRLAHVRRYGRSSQPHLHRSPHRARHLLQLVGVVERCHGGVGVVFSLFPER